MEKLPSKRKMIDTSTMSHQEWLNLRKEAGIGGSDVAAALGLSRYKSSYMLYLEKTGRYDPYEPSPAAAFGTFMEPHIRDHFRKVTGLEVQDDPHMYFHSDYPMLSGNIDGLITPSNGQGHGILEIKCSTSRRVPKLDTLDDVPISWRFQLFHYMSVLNNVDHGYLQVFQRDTARYLRPLRIQADQQLIAANNEQLAEFWAKYIEADKPPPLTSADDLTLRWPREEDGKIAKAAHATTTRYYGLKQVEERLQQLKQLRESMQLDLKKAMGDAELLLGEENQKLASWKIQSRNRFDTTRFRADYPELYSQYVNQNQSRVFRLS